MKEIKILIVLVIMVAVTYWGIEPLAHSQMHPAVSPVNYDFMEADKQFSQNKINKAQLQLDEKSDEISKMELQKAQDYEAKYADLWQKVSSIDLSKGDANSGKDLFAMACASCHGASVIGVPNPMGDNKTASEAFGVAAPDLSVTGYLYDDKFLAALIIDPVLALKVGHFFSDEKPFPMTGFFGLGGDFNQEVADIVAYINSIAPETLSNKEVFHNACQRCHDMKYDNIYTLGNKQNLLAYMGSNPPDLSSTIRSKGESYLHKFINDPQKMLAGTAMPRVGLNEKAQDQVVVYMQSVGDSKKQERENTSIKIMIYFAILSVFATLWKMKIWSKLH